MPLPPPHPGTSATTSGAAASWSSVVSDVDAGYQLLAEFPDYAGAQHLVDQLSDDGFPVERVRIIGTGIHSVEQVTGRLTTGRAALLGLGSGAWFGLLIGLLFGIFTTGWGWLAILLTTVASTAAFGALFGAITHWTTRGARDFASTSTLAAQTYSVHVHPAHLARAQNLLTRP